MIGTRIYDVICVTSAAGQALKRAAALQQHSCYVVSQSATATLVKNGVNDRLNKLKNSFSESVSDLKRRNSQRSRPSETVPTAQYDRNQPVDKTSTRNQRIEETSHSTPASSPFPPKSVPTESNHRPSLDPPHVTGKREYSTDSKAPDSQPQVVGKPKKTEYEMQSSSVPSSRLERLFHYGSLATGMGFGAITESIRRIGSDDSGKSSVLLNPANLERLVKKLSQMRGAALKVGQLLSFQGG